MFMCQVMENYCHVEKEICKQNGGPHLGVANVPKLYCLKNSSKHITVNIT